MLCQERTTLTLLEATIVYVGFNIDFLLIFSLHLIKAAMFLFCVSTSGNPWYCFLSLLQGSHVIMAVPPLLQQRIIFEPPLPGNRNQLICKYPMGSVIKTMTFYDKPYWREKGKLHYSKVPFTSLLFKYLPHSNDF